MAIIRIHTGSDGKSHFEEIVPKFEPRGDKSESAELIPGSGIVIRRFEATRSNPWHHAPGPATAGLHTGARRPPPPGGNGSLRPLPHPHSPPPAPPLAPPQVARFKTAKSKTNSPAALAISTRA